MSFLLLAACTKDQEKKPLTDEMFDAAKRACGATEAYLVELDGGGHDVSFRGVSKDAKARNAQAACLVDRLKGADVGFVVYLSE